MKRYTCPCCGMPYNGKRCRNCCYEHFSEEISHGTHIHTGEPLVIKKPERRPIPRRDAFDCDRKTKRSPLLLPVLVIAAALVLPGLVSTLLLSVSELGTGTPEPPETVEYLAVPADGLVVYEENGIRILADWQQDRPYEDGIRFYVSNDSDRDITVSSRDILVNGYLLEDALLYCQAAAGAAAEDTLTLDPEELEYVGIQRVQELAVTLVGYDSETYDTLLEVPFAPLCVTGSLDQPVDRSGQVLFDQEGLRITYRGYVPSQYDQQTFVEGTLEFLVENETEQYLDCYTQDVSVNGQDVPLSLWCSLPPHTRAVRQMYLYGLDGEPFQSPEDILEMDASFEFSASDSYEVFTQTGPLSIPVRAENQ